MPLKIKTLASAFLLAALALPAWAQRLVPTPAQQKKLNAAQVRLLDALKAQSIAARNAALAQQALLDACERIVHANHWPEGTACNPQTLQFVAPAPKPPAPKAEEKKP